MKYHNLHLHTHDMQAIREHNSPTSNRIVDVLDGPDVVRFDKTSSDVVTYHIPDNLALSLGELFDILVNDEYSSISELAEDTLMQFFFDA